MKRVLYEHLPRELPSSWIRSSYVPATHYQAWHLFNESNEFLDVYLRYLSLKEPTTALVRACSFPPRSLQASKKQERDDLLQRRVVFMGSDDQPGGNWDARIRSWIGLSDAASASDPLKFYKTIKPIKRESLEELMWRLGLQPYELPGEGWCGRKPYHAAERNWRESEGHLPRRLPKELKEKLLKPLREEVPELANLTEEELAGVLKLLKSNPPYAMARKKDLSSLDKERRDRVAREDNLQKTRVLTQLMAAREKRALEMLRKVLEEG